MKGISDLRITGIDETRPPYIRKEPYIDIFFKLSHQAPVDWCKNLNGLLAKQKVTQNATISEKEGEFIDTWVRSTDEISALVDALKNAVTECTTQYIEQIQLSVQNSKDANASQVKESSAQANLNSILASLNFDEPAG